MTIDLNQIIANATGPITLNAANQYVLNSLALLKYSINGNGATVICAQNTTNFKTIANDVLISNMVVPQSGLFVEFASNHSGITNCKLGIGEPAGSIQQACKTIEGGTNSYVSNTDVGITTTVSMYFDQSGIYLDNVNLSGSTNEYALRFDMPSSGNVSNNATVINSTIANNDPVKDAAGVRWYKDVKFSNCNFTGDIRWGQVNSGTNSVGQYATGSLTHCTFNSNGNPISLTEVYQGVELAITGCTYISPIVPPFTADVFSVITSQNNTFEYYVGEKQWEIFASSSKGIYKDLGGNKIITIPQTT